MWEKLRYATEKNWSSGIQDGDEDKQVWQVISARERETYTHTHTHSRKERLENKNFPQNVACRLINPFFLRLRMYRLSKFLSLS